jgi:hypothetical protein
MIDLTEEQRQALDTSQGGPVRVVDPRTNAEYVILSAEVYDRLRGLLGEDMKPVDTYPAVDRAFAEDWDDPRMDDYDRYEELKR